MARVLLIDDDDLVRATLRRGLAGAGHDVVDAGDGEKAMAAFLDQRFDVVVTDILMPVREGIETIREIRAHDSGIPIIAISGGGQVEGDMLLRHARILGADEALAKPFTARELAAVIERTTRRTG